MLEIEFPVKRSKVEDGFYWSSDYDRLLPQSFTSRLFTLLADDDNRFSLNRTNFLILRQG